MTINDIDESLQEVSQTEEKEIGSGNNRPISKPVMEELIYKSVGEVLGLENNSDFEKYKDDIQRIAEYAGLQGNEDPVDIKWFVRQLEMRLGTPKLGEKRVTNVARYVYLLTESDRIKDRLNQLSLGGAE